MKIFITNALNYVLSIPTFFFIHPRGFLRFHIFGFLFQFANPVSSYENWGKLFVTTNSSKFVSVTFFKWLFSLKYSRKLLNELPNGRWSVHFPLEIHGKIYFVVNYWKLDFFFFVISTAFWRWFLTSVHWNSFGTLPWIVRSWQRDKLS